MNASAVKQYGVVTGAYWGFTLTDGALRMLVVLYFHQLGYSPLSIAFLFLFHYLFAKFPAIKQVGFPVAVVSGAKNTILS